MEIHWRNQEEFTNDERIAADARIQAIDAEHRDLDDIRIAAKTTRHHRHGAREVRIACRVRGHELVASRTCAETGKALDEALDLIKHEVRRLRGRLASRRRRTAAKKLTLSLESREPTEHSA